MAKNDHASIAKEFIMVLYDNETFGPGHYELWETSWYAYLYDIINVNDRQHWDMRMEK